MGGRRGRLTPLTERKQIAAWVEEAVASGARKTMACKTIELPIRTLQRWLNKGIVGDDRRLTAKRPVPVNKLSDDDVARIVEICNREEYASLPPSQIVPRLADDNIYLASESTFYRVLKAHNQLHHRGRSQTP